MSSRFSIHQIVLFVVLMIVFASSHSIGEAQTGALQVIQHQGTSTRPPVVQQTFEQKFWDWLNTAQYRNWAPFPGQPAEAYEGQSPHGAMLKMYANRIAVSNSKQPPHGSIVVKENYGPDGKTLMAITVMYRTQGYNSVAGDWYWAKFDPQGKVAMKDGMRIAGKVKSCIECHSSADGNDFLFVND